MISDEELKGIASVDGLEIAKNYCLFFGLPLNTIEEVMGPLGKSQEMATELLQLREEKRKTEEAREKSWEGAPEWAKYRARDSDWCGYYFEERPTPLAHDWRITGRIADWASIPFESTLEERP